MLENNKINVSLYLKDLNRDAEYEIRFRNMKEDEYEKLTCKSLAEKVGVTPATITNLNTSSKFYLIYRISEEILDAYFKLLDIQYIREKRENPDVIIPERDKSYVMHCLTTYYSDEWLD